MMTKRILALFLCLLTTPVIAAPAHAAITVVSGASTADDDGGSTITVSINSGSGSDRAIVACVMTNAPIEGLPGTVKYNAVDLTQIGTSYNFGGTRYLSMWRLVANATGTNNLVADFLTPRAFNWIGAVTLDGVNQGTPVDSLDTATGATTPITNDVTSAAGDLVVDCVMVIHGGGGGSISVGASQTSRNENDSWSGGEYSSGMSTEEASGTPITMSWSIAVDGTWGAAAVNVNAASGGGSGTTVRHRRIQ